MLWNKLNQALLLLACFTIVSCSDEISVEPKTKVAQIGDQEIFQDELEFQLRKFQSPDSSDVRRKVLESLVMTRLFAQQQELSMTDAELRELNIATQAYRNELLAKSYIEHNIPRQVPDRSDVVDYYQKNKRRFGEKLVLSGNRYQLLESCKLDTSVFDQKSLSGNALDDVLASDCIATKSVFESHDDSSMEADGDLPVGFWRQGSNGQVLVVINARKRIPARPLSEVASEIRKSLAPKFLKQALIQHRDKYAREIEYFD